jgi:(p)ppGpp synthase/HD superfamily hydrolase
LIVTAYLHDAIEDTNITKEIIEEEFGKDISIFVDLLSKRDGELYDDYLKRLFAKPTFVSNAVKYCDLIFNIENCRKAYEGGNKHRKHMLEKYMLAKMMIEENTGVNLILN